MQTKTREFIKTLLKIRATSQFLTWTYLKFSTKRQQYFFSQFIVILLISVYYFVDYLNHDNRMIILYFALQVFLFIAIVITFNTTWNEQVLNRIYQVFIMLCYTGNQVMLLSLPHFQQIMTAVMTGYLLGWTTYSLSELEFRILLSFTSCGTYYYFNNQSSLLIVGFFVIKVIGSFCLEYDLLIIYLKHLSLFSIIERIPNAICIVNKQKTQLVYSNENFINLALTLNQDFDGDFHHDENEHTEQRQLRFLQNLTSLYTQVDNEGFKISDFLNSPDVQGITNDQFRIKKVFFDKNKQKLTAFRQPQFSQNVKSNKIDVYKQELKSLGLGQVTNVSFDNKAFIADIILEMELLHDPSKYIQSSLKKRKNKLNQRKISSQTQSLFLSPKELSDKQEKRSRLLLGLSNYDQIGSEEQFQQSALQRDNLASPHSNKRQSLLVRDQQSQNSGVSQIQHKMKFMVQLMENCNSFYLEEQLQIYFISELSPFILKTKVKKLEQVQKNLLRSISHELVTYLNGAFGYMNQVHQKMQQKNYDKEKVLKLVTLSIQYISLQIHKIQDLNDFKALLSGQFLLNNECFFLNQVIEECINLMKDQSTQKGIYLEIVIDSSLTQPLKIYCDKQRFCQVLLNLLSNAMRFTYEGGIIVQVKKADLQNLSDSFYNNVDLQNMVEINVVDTGIGMDEEQLGALTKKLLTESHGEKISKDSIGISMGLMLCKQILQIMGPDSINTLFVKSMKHQGSSFYFYLKLLTPEFQEKSVLDKFKQQNLFSRSQSSDTCRVAHSASIKADDIKIFSPHSSKHLNEFRYSSKPLEQSFTCIRDCQCNVILIVDDESFNIDILSHLVKQMGFTTETAYNGKQCIEKLDHRMKNHCQYDSCCLYKCILMDINMPVMNGWQAASKIQQIIQRRLNTNKLQPKIPVIAVTAFANPSDQEKCFQSGFDYVIVKPASKKNLQAAFSILNIFYTEVLW